MLYQDRTLGQAWIGRRLVAKLLLALRSPRHADLDLLSMSRHLQRDLGIEQSFGPTFEAWRK